jgi:predicted nucleic acid-binding Zn ribbon protein
MRRTQTRLIGDILEEFFKRPYVARKIAEGKLPEFWREIVGEHVANLTNDVRLERGILHVSVSSSVVRNDLFFRRDQLAQLINQRAGMQLVNAVIIR